MLEPVLRLASTIISNAHTWPWFACPIKTTIRANDNRWDALIAGKFEDMPADELEPRSRHLKCQRFFRRLPYIANTQKAKDAVQKIFREASETIEFHIASGVVDYESGKVNGGFVSGETYSRTSQGKTKLFISFELLEPLLNTKITQREC